jgi:hypothetical protein
MPALVECEVCDRSHAPNHPHITNIEGDTSIQDGPVEQKLAPVILLPADDQLPDWLRDKPAADATEDDKPKQICQVCGNPWAPRHACKGAEPPQADFNRPVSPTLKQTKCEACGLVKRSNHNCKAQPKAHTVKVAQGCDDCQRAGELCVRHGGVWSSYDTPRGATEPVARQLPKPVSVAMPEAPHKFDLGAKPKSCRNGHLRTPENTYTRSDGRFECKECKEAYKKNYRPNLPAEVDPEIAAMAALVEAVKGLDRGQLERVMTYVQARFGRVE